MNQQSLQADKSSRRLPVVVLSSSDVQEDIERAYDLGANSYVSKPVEFARYSETVWQICQAGSMSTDCVDATALTLLKGEVPW